jgi:hypothetical protein
MSCQSGKRCLLLLLALEIILSMRSFRHGGHKLPNAQRSAVHVDELDASQLKRRSKHRKGRLTSYGAGLTKPAVRDMSGAVVPLNARRRLFRTKGCDGDFAD